MSAAEIVEWTASDPGYSQNRALEGSGLCTTGHFLYATSEKYYRLLRIDTRTAAVDAIELEVPKYSELEGVTLTGGEALVCDEAHASVFAVELDNLEGGEPAEARQLPLRGIEVEGGKIGLEGITAVDDGSERVFLLLERSGNEATGCSSTVFPMIRDDGALHVEGPPLTIPLEDCNWRLTGLQWWKGWLIAIKTQYPGERYEIVTVDLRSGAITKVLDLTDLLVGVTDAGWSNNVEGITVTPDGSLWLLSDNAMTGVIDLETPPLVDDSTLLLRIPADGFRCDD